MSVPSSLRQMLHMVQKHMQELPALLVREVEQLEALMRELEPCNLRWLWQAGQVSHEMRWGLREHLRNSHTLQGWN